MAVAVVVVLLWPHSRLHKTDLNFEIDAAEFPQSFPWDTKAARPAGTTGERSMVLLSLLR